VDRWNCETHTVEAEAAAAAAGRNVLTTVLKTHFVREIFLNKI